MGPCGAFVACKLAFKWIFNCMDYKALRALLTSNLHAKHGNLQGEMHGMHANLACLQGPTGLACMQIITFNCN